MLAVAGAGVAHLTTLAVLVGVGWVLGLLSDRHAPEPEPEPKPAAPKPAAKPAARVLGDVSGLSWLI